MKKTINRWLFVFFLLFVISGVCLYLFRDSKGNATFYEGNNTVELCDNLELNLLKCNVRLIPCDGEEIRFEYKSLVPITVMKGDNRLVITESDEFRLALLSDGGFVSEVTLYLPPSAYEQITIYASSGNVSANGITADTINVITKSGDIDMGGCDAVTKLMSSSGNITLSFDEIYEESSIDARSGDAEIIIPEGSSLALSYETVSGEFISDMISGEVNGSYMFSFSGGEKLIYADVEQGSLTLSVKKE